MEIQKIMQTIDKSKNVIIQNVPEYVHSEALKNLLYGVPKELSEIKSILGQKCEEYVSNAFLFDNYIMIPADEELSNVIERVALKLDIFGSMSTLRRRNKISLNNNANLYFFSAGDAKKSLCKYNPKLVTDRAKTDFYNEMKRIIETGKTDVKEILNEKVWFMDSDGRKIYNLAPDIMGQTSYPEREVAEKALFDKLFNS